MALTRNEIQKKSDAKRGIVCKAFKLHHTTADLIKELSTRLDLPQSEIITRAVKMLDEQNP